MRAGAVFAERRALPLFVVTFAVFCTRRFAAEGEVGQGMCDAGSLECEQKHNDPHQTAKDEAPVLRGRLQLRRLLRPHARVPTNSRAPVSTNVAAAREILPPGRSPRAWNRQFQPEAVHRTIGCSVGVPPKR